MRTLEQTIAAATADMALKGCGIPNRNWPFPTGNYCCASVTHWMDDFGGHAPYAIENISISHLRADRKWPEGSKPKPGALVCMNFDGLRGMDNAEHIGLYRGTANGQILTFEGNTGPRPGELQPNGFYERARDPQNVVGYIYPPYAKVAAAHQEDSMNTPKAVAFSKDQQLLGGTWKTLELGKPGIVSFALPNAATNYIARAAFQFDGLGPDDIVQVRFIKVTMSATGKVVKSTGLSLIEIRATSGGTFGELVDLFALAKGERARVQVLGSAHAKLAQGNVSWIEG